MSLLETPRPFLAEDTKLYTAEDLEQMPSEARYELIRGELFPMPNNSAEHGYTTITLSILVGSFIIANDLGKCFAAETRFIVEENPDTTIAPDFAFIVKDRVNALPKRGYLKMAPDLVVETRSPGDRRREFALKIAQWINAGTQVVWAVEPASRTLTIHRSGVLPQTLMIQDTLTEETLLPGFSLPLARIFDTS